MKELSFAKSLCPRLKGFLPAWRKLFGLGLQADSSTVENARESVDRALAGYKKKSLVFRRIDLESTLPLHDDGAAAPSLGRD